MRATTTSELKTTTRGVSICQNNASTFLRGYYFITKHKETYLPCLSVRDVDHGSLPGTPRSLYRFDCLPPTPHSHTSSYIPSRALRIGGPPFLSSFPEYLSWWGKQCVGEVGGCRRQAAPAARRQAPAALGLQLSGGPQPLPSHSCRPRPIKVIRELVLRIAVPQISDWMTCALNPTIL